MLVRALKARMPPRVLAQPGTFMLTVNANGFTAPEKMEPVILTISVVGQIVQIQMIFKQFLAKSAFADRVPVPVNSGKVLLPIRTVNGWAEIGSGDVSCLWKTGIVIGGEVMVIVLKRGLSIPALKQPH